MNEQPIKRTQEEWDSFFLRFARDVAGMSKDPDRQVGAVVVTPDRRERTITHWIRSTAARVPKNATKARP